MGGELLRTALGGATDGFTVVLTSQPIADVTIALAGTQVTATQSPLTFTPGNWNQVQTVTVTAVDDAIDETDPHGGQVAFAVSSADPAYQGLPVAAVSVLMTLAGIALGRSAVRRASRSASASDAGAAAAGYHLAGRAHGH